MAITGDEGEQGFRDDVVEEAELSVQVLRLLPPAINLRGMRTNASKNFLFGKRSEGAARR